VSPIGEGWWAVFAIVAGAFLPTEVWRWLGVALGARINAGSEALVWVRAVATGIIAAFVAKMVFVPTGTLAETPLWLRLLALGAGIGAYALTRRLVVAGAAVARAVLAIGQSLL
jgi:branched-subunit amino acid transport protein